VPCCATDLAPTRTAFTCPPSRTTSHSSWA
jgi:hypothetical protein